MFGKNLLKDISVQNGFGVFVGRRDTTIQFVADILEHARHQRDLEVVDPADLL